MSGALHSSQSNESEPNIIRLYSNSQRPSQPTMDAPPIYTSNIAIEASNSMSSRGFPTKNTHERNQSTMDDKDVHRLEDRINASEERSQLRLERVAERIEGALARIADQNLAIRQDMLEQRADERSLRSEIKTEIESISAHERGHFYWIIVTVLAVGLGIGGLIVGFGQIWGSGVQFVQSAERNIQELLHGMQNTLQQIDAREKSNSPRAAPSAPESPTSAAPKTQP